MAEERSESRELTWRNLLPWTELFRTFQVALDLNKLLLAAAGIFVTALGWWLLSAFFFGAIYPDKPPKWGTQSYTRPENWNDFKQDRNDWNMMYEVASLKSGDQYVEPEDLADSEDELKAMTPAYETFKGSMSPGRRAELAANLREAKFDEARAAAYAEKLGRPKPCCLFST